jgi:hypothetical protein
MKKVAFGIALSALLVACGSGGGDSAQPVVQPLAKYVGTWDGACLINSSGVTSYSYFDRVTISLNANGTLAIANAKRYFDGVVCAGTAVGVINYPASTQTLDSTLVIGGETIERVSSVSLAGNSTFSGASASAITTGTPPVSSVLVTFGTGATMVGFSETLARASSSWKNAFKLNAAGTAFTSADSPFDADNYPSNFATSTYIYTKQ